MLDLDGVYSDLASAWDALPEDKRRLDGEGLALFVSQVVGGQLVYFKTTKTLTMPARDAEIRSAFNGRNHRELASRYGLSEQRIRDIVGGKTGKTEASTPREPGQLSFDLEG